MTYRLRLRLLKRDWPYGLYGNILPLKRWEKRVKSGGREGLSKVWEFLVVKEVVGEGLQKE